MTLTQEAVLDREQAYEETEFERQDAIAEAVADKVIQSEAVLRYFFDKEENNTAKALIRTAIKSGFFATVNEYAIDI